MTQFQDKEVEVAGLQEELTSSKGLVRVVFPEVLYFF